jgi:protein-arginine kinase activator protein McsA
MEEIVELERRICPSCNKLFKVLVRSNQIYCSQFCEGTNLKWMGIKARQNEEKHAPKPLNDIDPIIKSKEKTKETVTIKFNK